MAVVLINDTFKKYLINKPPDYRNKVKKQFEFLEIGSWDGGLNVKKIRGTSINKVIFEARLDRSDRILFTLGNDSSDGNLLIYIWGIVSHDNISLKSKSIIPENVPFLNFNPYSESQITDVLFEELDNSFFTQEGISKKISYDSGSQKWHQLNEIDWKRIQLYVKDDFELYLYLTPEQIDVLQTPPPILLSGTAGSGKTTIAVYYLLKTSISKLRKLFVTYNKYLKHSAERLYKGLLNAEAASGDYIQPDFFTYKEFCWNIAASINRFFDPGKEVNYEKFASLILSNSNALKYDITLIWEEIRSIIKGALPQVNSNLFTTALNKIKLQQIDQNLISSIQRQFNIFLNLESANKIEHIVQKYMRTDINGFIKNLNYPNEIQFDRFQNVIDGILELFSKQKELTKKKHLSFLEYEMLGKKKAPNFVIDRKDIYRIFEWYQDKLESNKLWDEIDLTREAINILTDNENHKFIYDLIVCDEVQDLTDVQHELLFYLSKSPQNLLLTGDTKQIINPSGFRWEELRQHFYSRNIKVPELNFLNLNFRSSGSIVELSNSLLDIKTGLLGLSSDQLKEDWKFKGRPPVVVFGIKEPDMINNLMITGAKKTILVRNDEERDKLKKHLGTELVFTIYEAKGLEFDTVLIWKFCADELATDIWKNISEESRLTAHAAKIKHEINLLYVAITRAQKDLLIYDGSKASVIWQNEQLKNKVFTCDDIDYVNNIWNVLSTPEEWLEQGNYFFEREYYKAAAECYKNADAKEQFQMAQAFLNEKEGKYFEAAQYFEMHNEIERAVSNYEKSSAFSDALRLWTQLKDKKKILEYRIKVLEKEEKYSELAQIYLKQKQYQKAADYFLKDKDFGNAAGLFAAKLRNPEKAAYYYETVMQYEKAAQLYSKIKNYDKAAQLFEKAGNIEKAEISWKKAKNHSRLIQFYLNTNNFEQLFKYYEKQKDSASAVKILKKYYTPNELLEQAQMYFASQNYYSAYLRYSALDNHKGIAESSYLLKDYDEAAKHYSIAGDLYSAGNAYERKREYKKAFLSYIKSEDDKKDDFKKTNEVARYLNYKDINSFGQDFFRQGNFSLALECSKLTTSYHNSGICYYEMGLYDEAVKIWDFCLIHDWIDSVAEFCLERHKPELVAKVIFNAETARLKRQYPESYINKEKSKLVEAMDRYFKHNPSEEEMFQWAERLIILDKENNYLDKTIDYFEKSKKYNEYYITIINLLTDYDEKYIFMKIHSKFSKSDSEMLPVDENLLIRFLIANKENKYKENIEKIEMNENNFLLFISSKQKDRALEQLFEKYDDRTIQNVLVQNRDFQTLAQFFESKGNKKNASVYYLNAEDYVNAARLEVELGNYMHAGDIYFEYKDYEKALEMYGKIGSNHIKYAKSLLKLAKYDQAAEIFKKLGKTKLYKDALKLKEKAGKPDPTLF